jgi:hypothetical protein
LSSNRYEKSFDDVGDPLEVIRNALIQAERDWDFGESSAVIFGIVCGWHEVLPEKAQKFGWSKEQIDRLARLKGQARPTMALRWR